jgi:exonuclease SbcC
MIREMLGLDNLDDVQAKIRSDYKNLENQIIGQRQNLLPEADVQDLEAAVVVLSDSLQESLVKLSAQSQQLTETETTYTQKKWVFTTQEQQLNEHNTLEISLSQSRERLKGLVEQQTAVQIKVKSLLTQQKDLEAQKDSFSSLESLKNKLAFLENELKRKVQKDALVARTAECLQQIQAIQSQLNVWQTALAGRDTTDEALRTKQQAIAVAEADINVKREEINEIIKQIGGISTSIREREAKLNSLRTIGNQGDCPTCLQPLLEGYSRVVQALDQEIKTLQSKELIALETRKNDVTKIGLDLKNLLDTLRAEEKLLSSQQSNLTQLLPHQSREKANLVQWQHSLAAAEKALRELGDVQVDENTYRHLKATLADLEPRYIAFQKTENYLSLELPASQASLISIESNISVAKQLLEANTALLLELNFQQDAYHAAKTDFTGFSEVLSAQSAVVRQLEKEMLEQKNSLAQTQGKLQNNALIYSQISITVEEMELLKKLDEHLAIFKKEILEKVSPGISREASDLFSRITKGKYEGIQVDDNFEFFIADGGLYYPIKRFSGGEIDLANFCLRIAVTKAIMDLSGSEFRLEFLAFDEIFGSQDEDRRLEMMLALNYLQEQFRQIYIVSHIESLRDYFPHLLEVQLAPEGSTVVWR